MSVHFLCPEKQRQPPQQPSHHPQRICDVSMCQDGIWKLDGETIANAFNDEECLEDLDLSEAEQVFVAKALQVAGVRFNWMTKVLG
jgi:hypothetical protein